MGILEPSKARIESARSLGTVEVAERVGVGTSKGLGKHPSISGAYVNQI